MQFIKNHYLLSLLLLAYIHVVLLRSTSRHKSLTALYLWTHCFPCTNKQSFLTRIFIYLLYSFIKHLFELYHHKSHSVYLHCLFHYKWGWDEIVRHMDKSDSNWCGTVFCKQNQIVFPSLESQVSLRVYHRHLMLKGSWEHQPEYWNQLRRMSTSFRNVPRWPWGQGFWCF